MKVRVPASWESSGEMTFWRNGRWVKAEIIRRDERGAVIQVPASLWWDLQVRLWRARSQGWMVALGSVLRAFRWPKW